MPTYLTLSDIKSNFKDKKGDKDFKIYAPKGVKIECEYYGESLTNSSLFLCQYKGQKFITNSKNIRLCENR